MSNKNYITNILNLKEENLIFKENFYHEQKIKDITHKVFEAYLSYKPTHCTKCGVLFDDKFEKHGFITSNIKIPDISGFKSILKLHKQRFFVNIVIKFSLYLLILLIMVVLFLIILNIKSLLT